jgi:hypothetical protein
MKADNTKRLLSNQTFQNIAFRVLMVNDEKSFPKGNRIFPITIVKFLSIYLRAIFSVPFQGNFRRSERKTIKHRYVN